MGSRGSGYTFFVQQAKSGKLPITDTGMTRFNITLDQSVKMVLDCLKFSLGGEFFVPKIPSYKITDVAKAVCPSCD